MSRNQNSFFATNPTVKTPRSRFPVSQGITGTCNFGKLVPFFWTEVLAGDSWNIDTGACIRLQTLLTPIFGEMYADIYYFYTPYRLLWEHYKEFIGEESTPWFDATPYSMPQISINIGNQSGTAYAAKGTVADYLGVPLPPASGASVVTTKINHMPFRDYVLIWNEWFRDENVSALAAFNTTDNDVTLNNAGDAFYGGALLPVRRFRDLWSSALPQPQRGSAVTIGLADSAPVFAGLTDVDLSKYPKATNGYYPQLRFTNSNPNNTTYSTSNKYMITWTDSNGAAAKHYYTNNLPDTTGPSGTGVALSPVNLYADMTAATGISINDLRNAFSMQRYLEALARGGNRYTEWLANIWSVNAPDASIQRPEYLGGSRLNLNVSQVVQQSETNTTPLGNTGAYSLTTDGNASFEKSFVEPGLIMGVLCLRYNHSYQDGLSPFFLRKDFEDYYNPYFNGVGEQPLLTKTLYAYDNTDHVFGYQEYAAEYRYLGGHRVVGEMRSNYTTSLDSWHLADDYSSEPYLDDTWMYEDGDTINRVLAVSNNVADQVLFDIYVSGYAVRPMPLYSIPGLDLL